MTVSLTLKAKFRNSECPQTGNSSEEKSQ